MIAKIRTDLQKHKIRFATRLHKLFCYLCGCSNSCNRISMNRMGKNSRLILILLAGLVILLHATIPHHHHLDSYSDHSSSSTTETRGESSPEANKHCHALNNIVLTKANSITIDTNTAFNALLFVITAFNLIKLYDSVLLATFPIKDIVILKQYFSSELSFRGPPTLV